MQVHGLSIKFIKVCVRIIDVVRSRGPNNGRW